VQILINSQGLNMNPLQSLYYVSPACLLGLSIPFRAPLRLICHLLHINVPTAYYQDPATAVHRCSHHLELNKAG